MPSALHPSPALTWPPPHYSSAATPARDYGAGSPPSAKRHFPTTSSSPSSASSSSTASALAWPANYPSAKFSSSPSSSSSPKSPSVASGSPSSNSAPSNGSGAWSPTNAVPILKKSWMVVWAPAGVGVVGLALGVWGRHRAVRYSPHHRGYISGACGVCSYRRSYHRPRCCKAPCGGELPLPSLARGYARMKRYIWRWQIGNKTSEFWLCWGFSQISPKIQLEILKLYQILVNL